MPLTYSFSGRPYITKCRYFTKVGVFHFMDTPYSHPIGQYPHPPITITFPSSTPRIVTQYSTQD